MWKRRIILVIGYLFFYLLMFCVLKTYGGETKPSLTITKWITENPPDVNKLSGKVYVVEFWAVWCGPCIKSIPHLNEIAEKYKDVPIISITPSHEEGKVRNAIRVHKIKYHVAFDAFSMATFKVVAFPTAFVIDHKGKIVWRGMPSNSDFEKAIRKAIHAIVQK